MHSNDINTACSLIKDWISNLSSTGDHNLLPHKLKLYVEQTLLTQPYFNSNFFDLRISQLTQIQNINTLSYTPFECKLPAIGFAFEEATPLDSISDVLTLLFSCNKVYVTSLNKDNLTALLIECLADIFSFSETIYFNQPGKVKPTVVFSPRTYQSEGSLIALQTRKSCVVVSGQETPAQWKRIGHQLFCHYGRSRFNANALICPDGFNLSQALEQFTDYEFLILNHAYANHYEYQRFSQSMSRIPFWDNGFSIFTPNTELDTPLGCCKLITYKSLNDIYEQIESNKFDRIYSFLSIIHDGFEPGPTTEPLLTPARDMHDFLHNSDYFYEKKY